MAVSKEEAKKLLIKRAMNVSFELFCKNCHLGINEQSAESKADGEDDANTKLPSHCLKWAQLLEDNKDVLLLGPREHAKSVTFERYILWQVARDPNIRVIVVSATSGMSEKILFFVKSNIESNDYFKAYYGDLTGHVKWTNNEIMVERSNKHERNVTIFACGITGTVTGRRANLLVIDDPIDVNALTPAARLKAENWLMLELRGCLGSGGRMIFIGSRKGPDDLYAHLERERPWIKVHVEKAIVDEDKKIALWPEKWSYEDLCIRRQEDPYNFALNFMNEVICTEGTLLDHDMVSNSIKPEYYLEYQGDPGGIYVMGIDHSVLEDPKIAAQRDSDYFAVVVLKKIGYSEDPQDNKYKVAYCYRERGISPEKQIERILEICERFTPSLIYTEATGFQKIYSILLRARSNLPFQPFQMQTKSKWNTASGLPTMRQSFNKGRFILPRKYKPKEGEDINDVKPDETMAQLIHECYTFAPEMPSGSHDDLFMAFFLADRSSFDLPLFYSKVWVGAV